MNKQLVSWSLVGAVLCFGPGCAGHKPAGSASDVQCPDGQTFDGQYCQVDQRVGTIEQPAPAPAESEPEPSSETPAPTEVLPADPNVPEPTSPAEPDVPLPEPVEPELPTTEATGDDEFRMPPPAAPVDYAMAAQAAPVMQYLASSHLPVGARPVGTPFAGQFATGQGLTKKVQLTVGKCYTIVGMGLPPVTEVDIKLVDPESNEVLTFDETTGPQAVVGSRDDCFQVEQSQSVNLVLMVTGGQGIAAAQVFSK